MVLAMVPALEIGASGGSSGFPEFCSKFDVRRIVRHWALTGLRFRTVRFKSGGCVCLSLRVQGPK